MSTDQDTVTEVDRRPRHIRRQEAREVKQAESREGSIMFPYREGQMLNKAYNDLPSAEKAQVRQQAHMMGLPLGVSRYN